MSDDRSNETKLFHALILQANAAHKAFNVSGPAVAQNALFDMRATALLLMQRLATIGGEDGASHDAR